VPVGAFAVATANRVHLQAGVFALDGRRAVRVEVTGDAAEAVAGEAARQLIDAGAGEILEARHDYVQNAVVAATSAGNTSNSPQWGQTPKDVV
jgi:hypothetical protein